MQHLLEPSEDGYMHGGHKRMDMVRNDAQAGRGIYTTTTSLHSGKKA